MTRWMIINLESFRDGKRIDPRLRKQKRLDKSTNAIRGPLVPIILHLHVEGFSENKICVINQLATSVIRHLIERHLIEATLDRSDTWSNNERENLQQNIIKPFWFFCKKGYLFCNFYKKLWLENLNFYWTNEKSNSKMKIYFLQWKQFNPKNNKNQEKAKFDWKLLEVLLRAMIILYCSQRIYILITNGIDKFLPVLA